MRRHKAQSMAFTGYTPGPNGDTSPTAGNQVNVVTEAAQVPTYLTGMIRSGMTIAAPTQHFTPAVTSALHTLCDLSDERVVDIVTAYIPQRPWWATPTQRGRRK